MRRSTLSTKLFVAALPLVLAVAALLALTVRSDLRDLRQAENGAELGRVWEPLINALSSVEREVADARDAYAALAADQPMTTADLAGPRSAADAAIDELVTAIDRLDGAESAKEYVVASRSSLLSGRRIVDRAILAPDMLGAAGNPVEAYERANRDLVAIGELLPSEAGDPELGAELLSVLKLARAKLAADDVIFGVDAWQSSPGAIAPLATARQSFADLENSVAEFEAVAPEDWLLQYRSSGFSSALAGFRNDLDTAVAAVQAGQPATFDDAAFAELVRQGVGFQSAISQSIVERAEADVAATRSTALRRIAITLGAVLLALAIAWFVSRTIARRIKAVAAGANRVADEQLPALVEALQDPRGKAVLPEIEPVTTRGTDELAELAEAFNAMQGTLVDVAQEQVEVLRRGVSDIFVTMARRNRSLIDRQLAMLDEFEAEVDDPDILSNYYQLDHLATRMRRNSESLLVLANAEPKRKRVKATEIDDVVRASIGEVEDYRRIEIEALESLQVRGNVVADISHLLAELLDNATSFSPPDSVVRVGGRRAGDTYMLRIVDDGVGIGTERMRELNELLREPPIVGLSVEATLGMSVVSLLANKHGIRVTLAAGNPGLTVDVVLPSTVFGPIETPHEPAMGASSPAIAAASTPAVADEPIVDWGARTTFSGAEDAFVTDEDTFVPEHEQPPAPAPAISYDDPFGDDQPRVATSDWSKMSLDLSAFRSGMQSATADRGADDAQADDTEAEVRPDVVHEDAPVPDPEPLTEEPIVEEPVAEKPIVEEPVAEEPIVAEPIVEEPIVEEPVAPTMADVDPEPVLDEPLVDESVDPVLQALEAFETTAGHPAEEPLAPSMQIPADEPAAPETALDEPAVTLRVPDLTTEPEPSADEPVAPAMGSAADEPVAPVVDTPADEPVDEPVVAPVEWPADRPVRAAARHGEFDRPLAPPISAAPLTQRPVAPADALAAPSAPPQPDLPGLPTRSPGSGRPDGGPDRLADLESDGPSALAAALDLPTRTRVGEQVDPGEEPLATAASRLDPDALRERLRAFQTEFRTGHGDTDHHIDHHIDHDTGDHAGNHTGNHSNGDLGGDR